MINSSYQGEGVHQCSLQTPPHYLSLTYEHNKP